MMAMTSFAVIAIGIALAWLGLRPVASLDWLLLLAFSLSNAILINYVWGMVGFGFVLCGFAGVLLQTGFNPSTLFAEIAGEYFFRPPLYQTAPSSEIEQLRR